MKTPKVSIVTVNYKQRAVTCELLDTIADLSYPNLETIVVDNEQKGDDKHIYRLHLQKVKVINVVENVGFAGGNNLGIQQAEGDYIFLLNNDTEVHEGLIESLLDGFKNNERIGAISPIIKYFDTPDKIQFAGFTEVNTITGRNDLIQKQPDTLLTDTAYFHGAAVMIPKHVIEKCGLMPEEYFLYYEELDWSRIMKGKGFELKVRTDVAVLHKESISTGKNSPLKVYYQNRNRIHFMRKSNRRSRLFFLTFFVLVAIPKNLLQHLIKRDFKHFQAFVKAIVHGLISPKIGFQNF
ncbi:MAG: GT2 family glycosyltransferase [Roseivirga sp.]|jgi:GT2 family glycosyltransferase